ncbi:unnamed protein product [Pieris brassicae]|uniref:Uncharacterized protein n=1 Tax=Pieris brassicae TaxID=7116 RepID=A0A9P0TS99_PIEBR|nr:unnamed protein product [Pieris brassicae]
MKRIMHILFLMSFVYLLKADEDATPDESKTIFEDYPSIELAVTPMDVASDMDEKPDYAYLKDSSSEEIYKAANVSQFKDSSSEIKSEKDSEKAEENLKDTDTAGPSHSLNHTIISESRNNTDSNKQNKTLMYKSVHDSKILNDNETIADSQDDDKPDVELVDKTFKSDLEKPSKKSTTSPKPNTTMDDMDDLILEKYIKSFDDDEFDKSLHHETQSKFDEGDSELDGLDHDFQPSRRMFDFVPDMNYKGRSKSRELLETSIPITAPEPPLDDRPNTFPSILLPNIPVPDPYRLKNIRLPHNNNEGLFQFGDSQDILNSRGTLFGSNVAEENKLNIQNGFGMLQEMINNQNRMAPEIPDISGPNKWNQALTLQNEANTWIPNVMTVPNRWKLTPGYQNIPNGWLHLSTLNIPNGFIPTRTKLSQEIYDPTDFETNSILPFEYTTLDSNAYPYVLAKRPKITETNRNLVIPPSLPNPQLPYIGFGIIRYPGAYPTLEPRLMGGRNLALVPRSQRFLIDNSFLYNRMCCY